MRGLKDETERRGGDLVDHSTKHNTYENSKLKHACGLLVDNIRKQLFSRIQINSSVSLLLQSSKEPSSTFQTTLFYLASDEENWVS